MRTLFLALAAGCLAMLQVPASASPGDVFVPAHRTRDGTYVPPNVAPLSGGTYLARRPTRNAAISRSARRVAGTSAPVSPSRAVQR